jgi:hypothetical protein
VTGGRRDLSVVAAESSTPSLPGMRYGMYCIHRLLYKALRPPPRRHSPDIDEEVIYLLEAESAAVMALGKVLISSNGIPLFSAPFVRLFVSPSTSVRAPPLPHGRVEWRSLGNQGSSSLS